MRGNKSSWRYSKMTVKFATIKAIVIVAVRHCKSPVNTTIEITHLTRDIGEKLVTKVTYKMVLEALHELYEQGQCDYISNSRGLHWWSSERLI